VSEHFFSLTPERVLEAVEASGVHCTGLIFTLNSLENRVYDLELDDRTRVIAKFYRPGRWSAETILDEHRFLFELDEAEIPVCTPIRFPDGESLHQSKSTGIFYALFKRAGGRAPEELSDEEARRLGRLLARIHIVGAARAAPHRPRLSVQSYGRASLEVLEDLLPLSLRASFVRDVETLLDAVENRLEGLRVQRIHGDCHRGNLLWGTQGPFFLDFDDMLIGPPVQDVWLLLPGRDKESLHQRDIFLEAYESMCPFDRSSLNAVEGLRALRLLRYAAWIARRWEDPSFPRAFPHFGTQRYWEELLGDLRDQLALLEVGARTDERKEQPAAFSVRFVPVNHADIGRIMAVRDEVFVGELGWSEEDEQDGRDAQALHLLAEDAEGVALGAMRLLNHTGTTTMTLSRLAVRRAHRLRGVGRMLVARAESFAHMMGAPGVEVETRVEAIPFFGTMGYVAEGAPRRTVHGMVRRMVKEW